MERRRLRLYLLWALLAAGLVYALWGFSSRYLQNRKENGLIYASGRIEGTEVTVGTKVAGRLERLLVDEGDRVEKAALLAEISSEDVRARWERAQAATSVAQRNLARQTENIRYWDHKVTESETGLELLRKQVRGGIAQSVAALGAATADLARAEANLDWWQRESRRLEDLHRQGMVSTQALDNGRSSLRAAQAETDRLRQEKDRARAVSYTHLTLPTKRIV